MRSSYARYFCIAAPLILRTQGNVHCKLMLGRFHSCDGRKGKLQTVIGDLVYEESLTTGSAVLVHYECEIKIDWYERQGNIGFRPHHTL